MGRHLERAKRGVVQNRASEREASSLCCYLGSTRRHREPLCSSGSIYDVVANVRVGVSYSSENNVMSSLSRVRPLFPGIYFRLEI